MLNYILRRAFYSVLVVFGVLILTFFMFRVAAGDPAAAILGKNPSPRDVDAMRHELGVDLPVFFGRWRLTEAFSRVEFTEARDWLNVRIEGTHSFTKRRLNLAPGSSVIFKRNFDTAEPLSAKLTTDTGIITLPIDAETSEFRFADTKPYKIQSIAFYRQQDSLFNSQFTAALAEIISFHKRFPYVNFFNFGNTLITREPVKEIILRGIVPSLLLMIPIFIGEMVLGIAFALLSAAFKGSWLDRALVLFSVIGMSISYLVFIIFGQWYLGYYFNWFPVWGWGGIQYLALPILIGIASGLGGGMRFYRTVFINELNREYLRTAQAKGCSALNVYCRHLLRNTALPIISRMATILPFLFTGSLLLESFFGIPGLGFVGIDALNNSDLQLLKALVVMSAFLFTVINLTADIAYAWVDPRVRLKK
ncbi:MAG: ABC transporter permease [Victivallaceae bacterium]|nr:ABC transporter permease [Victivallaceae bacterium]